MSDLLPASVRPHSLFVVEAALILAALFLAFAAPRLGDGFFARVTAACGRLARRSVLSLVVIGLAPILCRLVLLPVEPRPEPYIHDEFSYLLAADTFAHGRVANPPHPLWQYFESIHILQQPTYASMYPPGQGIFLALGQVLTGRPWAGVMLSAGLFCAALLWMLRGWFPPGWAFLGASLAVLRIGIFSYWMNSYWGGAASAIGGALAAGALARLWKRPRPVHGAIMGFGIVLLANTRPFEGALFALPLVAALLLRRAWRRALVPLALLLAAGTAATCYYNWRVTGHPFLLPQQLQRAQYAVYPYLAFQPTRPEPIYRHAAIRDFYLITEAGYRYDPGSPAAFLKVFLHREAVLFWFYLGPVLLVPLLLDVRALFERKLAILWIAFLATTAGLAFVLWPLHPHYYAPAACAIYAFVVQSLRSLRHAVCSGRPAGLFLLRAIPSICVLMALSRALAAPLGIDVGTWPLTWYNTIPGNAQRAAMLAELRRRPEKTLVVVRYGKDHDPEHEWVYNEAGIDGAKVIWAREMPDNADLLRYFRGRQAVLVEPDVDPAHWRPYEPPPGRVLP